MTALAYSRMRGPGDFDAPAELDSDERVAELTEQLVDERVTSPRHVAEALDDLAGTSDHNSDGNTHFSADLASALMGSEADGIAYLAKLREKVREYLQRDASTDAEFRIAKFDDDSAEMRMGRAA